MSVARAQAQIKPVSRVTGILSYVVPPIGKPHSYMYDPPPGVPKLSASYEQYGVPIHNLRLIDSSLDKEGFRLARHESRVRDFFDDAEVRSTHYGEIEKMVGEATGASRVVVFDHTVRRRTHEPDLATPTDRREPVPRVHVDYTLKSGPQRVRDLMAGEADALLLRRFSIINVWRPMHGPLEDWPLALCDASSVAPGDLIATDLFYTDRIGETYSVRHNPRHRWFYAPRMTRDEALLFRCYDSTEHGAARFVPHAAFRDPTAPSNAAPRESIELRCLVFY